MRMTGRGRSGGSVGSTQKDTGVTKLAAKRKEGSLVVISLRMVVEFDFVEMPSLESVERERIRVMEWGETGMSDACVKLAELQKKRGDINVFPRPSLTPPYVWVKHPIPAEPSQERVIIDAMDTAYSYGMASGRADFAGIHVALEYFLKQPNVPHVTVIIHAHELHWWRLRQDTSPEEVAWREALIRQPFVHMMSSCSYHREFPGKDKRNIMIVGMRDSRGNVTPAEPAEVARNIDAAREQLQLVGSDPIRGSLCSGRVFRTAGQWAEVIGMAREEKAQMLSNSYEYTPDLCYLDTDLIDYITRHKLLYIFITGQWLAILDDTSGTGSVETPAADI